MSMVSQKGRYLKNRMQSASVQQAVSQRKREKKPRRKPYKIFLLILLLCGLGISSTILLHRISTLRQEQSHFDAISNMVATDTDEIHQKEAAGSGEVRETTSEQSSTSSETEAPTQSVLPQYETMLEENPDFYGWLKIPETKIDFPVMYTPDDPEKYLHLDFYGNYAFTGIPFMDAKCDIDSDQILVHGHNMNNGQMFQELLNYAQKDFWQSHPVIQFDTLYEKREYEVIAAFYDCVHYKYEDVFRYYYFTDGTQEQFEEAVAYYKEHACYDTGRSAEYGDQLLALSTCSYHTEDGRFVVIGRRIWPDES